jgi:hypothetical protein
MCTWARYTRAAMMLAGGLGFYFSVFNFAKYMDKPSQQPFTDKVRLWAPHSCRMHSC